MMQQAKPSCGVVMVCALLCGMIASCGRSDKQSGAATIEEANAVLEICELPTLPPSVTSVQCWKGGVFAKFLNVKFMAAPEEAIDYSRRAGAEGYFEFREDAGKYSVIAPHTLTDSPVTAENPGLFELQHKTGMASEPWFNSVYEIRHGWYWTSLRDIAGYQLYYDVDTQQLYIYWWYS
jgi:hypothetical protein